MAGWRRFLHRGRWDAERRRELDTYLDIETDENVARGMTPTEARAAAHRTLGNATLVREEIYRMNTLTVLESIWQDVRVGLRALTASRVFTVAAMLSLTLGIGATTAIFQLLDAVRLRALPVAGAHELVEVRVDPASAPNGRTGSFSGPRPMMTYPLWDRLRRDQRVLDRPFAWGTATFDLATGGESRFVPGLWASGELFGALQLAPAAGRLLTPADDEATCASRAVVISHAFWQREYNAAPSAIGQSIRLDGQPFQIAGVAPASFFGLEVGRRFDVAAPLCAIAVLQPESNRLERRDAWWLSVMGRLPPGMTAETAGTQLAALGPGLFDATVPATYSAADVKNYLGFRLTAVPAGTGVSSLRRTYEQPLWVLLSIAGLVLLIASGNLANLMLARASAREREMAVRLAIGASRPRLLRQLLIESLMLSIAGAILGALLARALSGGLLALLSADTTPAFLNLSLDWRVLSFTAGLAVLTALIFGLAPAVRATRTPPGAVLKIGTRGAGGSVPRFGIRRVLTVGQIALSFVLVVAAILFARTLGNLTGLHPGFEDANVLSVSIDHRRAGIPPDERLLVQQRFIERLEGLPGVAGAAIVAIVPLSGSGWNQSLVIDGQLQDGYPNVNRVSARYFELLRIPRLSGRSFTPDDTRSSPPVAVISRSFADKYYKTPSPLGRTFRFGDDSAGHYQVIGVVEDTKYSDLREPVGPIIYLADTQEPDPTPSWSLLVRAARPEINLAPLVTQAAAELHPSTLVSFQKLDDQRRGTLVREQLMATLSGFFGALAGLLAAVGLYGVMSYLVARRRGEFGVRLALGARPATLLFLVLREAGVVVAIGLAIGLALALAGGRAAETLLFGLDAADVPTLALSAIAVVVVALTASALPARRASLVAPSVALRNE